MGTCTPLYTLKWHDKEQILKCDWDDKKIVLPAYTAAVDNGIKSSV